MRAQKQALGQPPSDLSSSTMNKASDNSAQSQGKKSGNVKGGIEAKQVDAFPDISEPIDEAAAMQDDSLDLGLAASGGMSPWKNPLRRKFALTVKRKIEQFKEELRNRILSEEEQGIYDVTVGKRKVYEIQNRHTFTRAKLI